MTNSAQPQISHFTALARRGFLTVAGMAALAGTVGLAPEPDPIPRRWQLDVAFSPVRVHVADVEGKGTKAFFYLTYKVTNNSGKDVLFAPSFELSTGDQPVRSGRDVPGEVTKALLEQTQNPLVQDQIAILGNILQGPENAKEGLVVWTADNLKPDRLVMYAAGFSGETTSVTPPTGGDPVLLRKTKMIRYELKGELVGQGQAPIEATEQRWIMR